MAGGAPHHQAYQEYVYHQAERGERWAYGFALQAMRLNEDLPRAVEIMRRFENDPLSEHFRSEFRMVNYLAAVATKDPTQFDQLSAEQKAFINGLLDAVLPRFDIHRLKKCRQLLTVMRRQHEYEGRLSVFISTRDMKRADLIIAQMLPRHVPLKDYAKEWEQMKQAKQQYKSELFHVGLVMEKYLAAGEYRGYSREEMRLIFRLMEQEDKFEEAFPGEGMLPPMVNQ